MKNISEIADVIRSKNAGPYEITLDIIFKTKIEYQVLKRNHLISKEKIADIYQIPVGEIKSIIYYDPAIAIKITLIRKIVSGSPGDTDVYGAQQHAPLLQLNFDSSLFLSKISRTR